MTSHPKVLEYLFFILWINSSSVHDDNITLFWQQWHLGMECSILSREVAGMTCVFCLSSSDLPHLEQSMDWGNEHFLNLCKLWEMGRWIRPRIHVVRGLIFVAFLA